MGLNNQASESVTFKPLGLRFGPRWLASPVGPCRWGTLGVYALRFFKNGRGTKAMVG